jgi:hypothetical protein
MRCGWPGARISGAIAAFGAFALAGAVAGCVTLYTPWPGEGGGGEAELHSSENEALVRLKERFRLLLDRGASEKRSAQMLHAQTLLIRAYREEAGGLYIDAGRSISEASAALDDIEGTILKRHGSRP